MLDDALAETLYDKYSNTGKERVGYISGNEIIEFENVHPDPERFFEVSLEDMERIENDPQAKTIWHTQPSKTSQLSYEDYVGFFSFPELTHVVIGYDGIRSYAVEGNAVIKTGYYKK